MVVVTYQQLLQAYFEDAGHWLYIEQPQAFNHLVLQFAAEAPPIQAGTSQIYAHDMV